MQGIRWNTLLRIVVGVVQVGMGLEMVVLSRRFIDETIRSGTDREVWLMAALLAVVLLSGVALRQLYYYWSTIAQTKQSNILRIKAFGRLFSRRLYDGDPMHSGDVSSRLAKDIDVVAEATTSLLPKAVITLIQLVGAFLLMHSMDRLLAWTLLVFTPLVLVFGKLIARPLRQMTLDIRRDESRIQMQVQEGMEHNATLRSLGSEQWVTGRLDTAQEGLMGHVKRRTRFTVFTRVILASCFTLGYLMAFVWGGLQLRSGAITFGVMTAFLQLVSQIQNPILTLLNMVPQLIHTTASIDRLEDVLQVEPETAGDEPLVPVSNGIAGVRVDVLSFRYPSGDRAVFDHFSHDFRPGSKTALTGPTGIGKTTLFRLMLALTEPQGGRIVLYDGMQEQTVSPLTRADFVFVPQGNSLMSGTVRFNLQLARPDADDDLLRHVLHTASADFVSDLPEGLDTELGERGIGLSEGQAQRIAIARGLLRPGSILLLDEISASLDEATERELFKRLFADFPDRTFITITHRAAVAALCDNTIAIGA
ncbi:MAG: ABC transporter ATP-binding protein [Bacteroidales bacterium]|nr:ABC transporter ATP-binding protein [Bacteroidales bacterium]